MQISFVLKLKNTNGCMHINVQNTKNKQGKWE